MIFEITVCRTTFLLPNSPHSTVLFLNASSRFESLARFLILLTPVYGLQQPSSAGRIRRINATLMRMRWTGRVNCVRNNIQTKKQMRYTQRTSVPIFRNKRMVFITCRSHRHNSFSTWTERKSNSFPRVWYFRVQHINNSLLIFTVKSATVDVLLLFDFYFCSACTVPARCRVLFVIFLLRDTRLPTHTHTHG